MRVAQIQPRQDSGGAAVGAGAAHQPQHGFVPGASFLPFSIALPSSGGSSRGSRASSEVNSPQLATPLATLHLSSPPLSLGQGIVAEEQPQPPPQEAPPGGGGQRSFAHEVEDDGSSSGSSSCSSDDDEEAESVASQHSAAARGSLQLQQPQMSAASSAALPAAAATSSSGVAARSLPGDGSGSGSTNHEAMQTDESPRMRD